MNTALWVAQLALATIFLLSGTVKSLGSRAWLIRSGQTGVAPYPTPFIRFIALAELAGAAGLVLPWATGLAPALTPVSAACLAVIMVGAGVTHLRLARANPARRSREHANVGTNVLLFTLCVLVALGRACA